MADVAPVRPGEDLDWPRLEHYLQTHLDDADGTMEVLQFPNGSANLTYLVRFGDQRYVVRRPPFGVARARCPRHEAGVPGPVPTLGALPAGRRAATSSVTTAT